MPILERRVCMTSLIIYCQHCNHTLHQISSGANVVSMRVCEPSVDWIITRCSVHVLAQVQQHISLRGGFDPCYVHATYHDRKERNTKLRHKQVLSAPSRTLNRSAFSPSAAARAAPSRHHYSFIFFAGAFGTDFEAGPFVGRPRFGLDAPALAGAGASEPDG